MKTSRWQPLALFLKATELDTRMLGLVGALLLIWIAFHVLSGGLFLTPRNLWNFSVQSSSVAIMATGMVLVIVTRNIDLSIGSMLGFIGMVMGVVQTLLLPQLLGFEHPATWVLALAAGLLLGIILGAFQGFVIAYLGIPSFIVTLGGLLVWRGAAWWVTHGQTVAPLDRTFRLMGGGTEGSIGAAWSWVVGVIGCVAVVMMLALGRARRTKFHFPLRPIAAEIFLAGVACTLILGAVAIFNAYPWPAGSVRRYAQANHIALPAGGLFIAHGIALPVLIAVGVGVAVTFLATRTRFGRYAYAIGGNPEAAELAGVNTCWVIMKIFMLMGLLTAISARDLDRPSRRGDKLGRHARRTPRHRRCRDRRNVALGRRRQRSRRNARRAADAIAAIGHGAARRRHAAAEYRRWRHSGLRRGPRHRLSAANQIADCDVHSQRPSRRNA